MLLCSLLGLLALVGCAADPAWTGDLPAPDRAMFENAVYPMLLRDCAFTACHGGEYRFLQVFGPGRVHLENAGTGPEREARERQLSYDRARSMLVSPGSGSIFKSPLLTKPLEVGAGGASHKGVDNFGRNVFQSAADPRYQLLVAWAQTSLQQPATTLPPPIAGAGALDAGILPIGGAPGVTGMQPITGAPIASAPAAMSGASSFGSAGAFGAPAGTSGTLTGTPALPPTPNTAGAPIAGAAGAAR